MKRVWQWLFNIVAAVSLVVTVATVILWVRSYWIADIVFIHPGSWDSPFLRSDEGKLLLRVVRLNRKTLPPPVVGRFAYTTTPPGGGPPAITGPLHGWLWHGFGLDWTLPGDSPLGQNVQALQAMLASLKQVQAPTPEQLRHISEVQQRIDQLNLEIGRNSYTDIQVPTWFIVLLAGIAPGLWLWRYLIRRRRVTPGLCIKCGYDLRATPERCPECGTITSSL